MEMGRRYAIRCKPGDLPGKLSFVKYKFKKGGNTMKTIKRRLALILVFLMASNFMPVMANEGVATNSVTVTVSAQAGYTYLLPRQSVEVQDGLAEQYGYQNADSVQEGEITVLDVLVATTKSVYGDAFTPQTAKNYLEISDSGSINKIFREKTVNVGFAVNGAVPNDGDYSNGYALGYTIHQTVVSEMDTVEFFIYQDDYALDNYSWFTYQGEKVETLQVAENQDIFLKLEGYVIGWYGCNEPSTIERMTGPVEDMQLVIVDEQGEMTPVSDAITDEEGKVTLNFEKAGTYTISAYGTEDANDYESYIIMPWCTIEVLEEVEPTFEDDIWLQYDYKELAVGEKADIYPRRVPQIVNSAVGNQVTRPNFNYEIISGDSVELSTTDSYDKSVVTAVKPGTTIIKVSYDAVVANKKVYAKCQEANEAYLILEVSEPGVATNITIDSTIPWRSYDTLYFTGDTMEYSFQPKVENAASYQVTCNGEKLTGQNGKYTATLENRSNIIGIVAEDADGNTKSFYQVVDARKIEIKIENVTSPGKEITCGDTIEVSFLGITMPVYKLATIYNPAAYNPKWNTKGTYVSYTDDTLGEVRGYCKQWDLATNNTITITPTQAGTYTFHQGHIFSEWYGLELGQDKVMEVNESGGIAPLVEGEFSSLPNFTLTVYGGSSAGGIEDNKETGDDTSVDKPDMESGSKDPVNQETDKGKKEKNKKPTIKKVTLKSVKKASAKTLKITWKKAGNVSGYKLYRKVGKGKYKRIAIIKGKSKTTYRDKKIKKGKTYSYKVRAYKIVNGKTYHGKYSNVKKKKS